MRRLFRPAALAGALVVLVYLTVESVRGGDGYYSGFDLAVARVLNLLDPVAGPVLRRTMGRVRW